MQLKLTFEDGSSAFLAHHGVKGMKWGVHNEETQQKYGETGAGLAGGGGAVSEDDKDVNSDESRKKENQSAEGSNPLAALQSGFSDAKKFASSKLTEAGKAVENSKKFASSKLTEAGKAAEDGKKQIDNYFKYRGNKAVKKSNFTFSSGGYESKDHAQKLRNGRRRSWTSAKYYNPNTMKTTDKTNYDARPSERHISRWGL